MGWQEQADFARSQTRPALAMQWSRERDLDLDLVEAPPALKLNRE